MSFRSSILLSLFLLLPVSGLVSCKGSEPESSTESVSNEPIRTGAILPLSGTLANYGELEQRGLELAVKHINEAGGIGGRPLEILYEDSELDPKKAISAFNKLVSVDKVEMITGVVGSSVCLAIAPLATREEMVFISGGATSPKLSGASPYFFRVAPSDTVGAARLVDWAIEEGSERIAILVVENDYGVGQKDVAVARLAELGKEPVIVESVIPDTSDLRPQIERIRKANPDTIFLLTHGTEAAYYLKQAQEAGFEIQAYGGDSLTDPSLVNIAGAATEGVRYLLPAKSQGPKFDAYAAAYQAAYGEDAEALGLKTYSLAHIAVEALRNAESTGQSLRDYIASKDGFDTAMGVVQFDDNGDIVDARFDRLVYENQEAVPFEEEPVEEKLAA